jgi:protein TonB
MNFTATPGERLRAALPVLLVHALLGFVFLRGLTGAPEVVEDERLQLIDVPPPEQAIPLDEPPPPPPAQGSARPLRAADPRPEGAASPPNLEAQPTPIVVPAPIVPTPPPPQPIRAAPIAGTGFAPSAGAAPVPGPGTGSGGIGNGTGSGRGGGGPGGGGGGGGNGNGYGRDRSTPPRLIRGRLSINDLPEELEQAGIGGTVSVIYAVEVDGRATNCRITDSSGHRVLDQMTCRLIEQRFRFRPALDEEGRPMRSNLVEDHHWEVEIEPPAPRRRRGW